MKILKKKKEKQVKIDKNIKYSIEYHKQLGKYIIWGEINSEHGFCVRGIFQGTKKECQEKLNEIKGV